MNISVKEVTRPRKYFDCGNPSHNHLNRLVAERCASIPKSLPTSPRWSEADLSRMIKMRDDGASYKFIAEAFNRTAGRIRQLVEKHRHRALYKKEPQ